MFTSLIFFILALLAIDAAPSISPPYSLEITLGGISLLFTTLITLNLLQKRWVRGWKREALCHIEALSFLLAVFYGLGLQEWIPPFFAALIGVGCYFISLGVGHNWHLVRFLFPFSFPFLIYVAASSLLVPLLGESLFLLFSLALLLTILLLLPLSLRWVWKCHPLPLTPLKAQLEATCTKQNFRHGGLLVWSVIRGGATAAIIGILPRFRYVLFTEKLLSGFPDNEIEAVMVHEMGHSVHKHLLIYPFLLLGLPILGALLKPYLLTLPPLLVYFSYALLIFFYIRFLIGFFSRNFERQADLNVFAADLSGSDLTQALERVASINALPLEKRSWHHGSLAKRIAYIRKAEVKPQLIRRTHTLVRLYLTTYALLLAAGTYMIWR